jgi:hypothetical protein
VAAIVQVVVYVQMKGIMESSSGQTEKLITAANTQAGAATSFSATASQINQGIQNGVTDLGRPYIFVTPVEPGWAPSVIRQDWDRQLSTARQLFFNPTIFNMGVSPAINIVASRPQVRTGPHAKDEADHCAIRYDSHPISAVLAPQSWQRETAQDFTLQGPRTKVFAPSEIADIKTMDHGVPKYQITVFGGVKYSGMRGGDFETRYCFMFVPTGMPYAACNCVSAK